jgi:hypothetical protein
LQLRNAGTSPGSAHAAAAHQNTHVNPDTNANVYPNCDLYANPNQYGHAYPNAAPTDNFRDVFLFALGPKWMVY